MRIGLSPAKTEGLLPPYGRHRVIVPVYIPHQEGYFKDALEVLRLCLESLTRTTADKATITLISNGCIAEAVEMMQQYFQDGKVDQLIIHQQNRGKVDALVSAMRGSYEELLTVSDGDVLFKLGWLEAVEQVFEHFPEAGIVSPVPLPRSIWSHTSATLPGAWLRGEIAFEKIVLESDLDRHSQSIGNPDFYGPHHKAIQTVVVRKDFKACVGCSHFVATFRRSATTTMPLQPSLQKLGHSGVTPFSSETIWLDTAPERAGYWRLATVRTYAYHMGNSVEPWMHEELSAISPGSDAGITRPPALPAEKRALVRFIPLWLRCRLIARIKRFPLTKLAFTMRGYPAHLPLP